MIAPINSIAFKNQAPIQKNSDDDKKSRYHNYMNVGAGVGAVVGTGVSFVKLAKDNEKKAGNSLDHRIIARKVGSFAGGVAAYSIIGFLLGCGSAFIMNLYYSKK